MQYFASRCLLSSALAMLLSTGAVQADSTLLLNPKPALAHQTISESTHSELPEAVLQSLNDNKVPADNISIYVRDLYADQAMLAHNTDLIRAPASTIKLVTTYAALKQLGPNYAWRTEAWLRGTLQDGVLDGDLILKGYGDPFLVYERFWKFLHELREQGLQQINGDIIIDNQYFDIPKHDPGAFDGQRYNVYNAGPSALMFNFQASRILIKPSADEAATQPDVVLEPSSSQAIDNRVTLVQGRCKRMHGRPKLSRDADDRLIVEGSFSSRCEPQSLMRVVSEPDQHVFDAFTEFWTGLGGSVGGGLKNGRVTETDELFHTYASPTLAEQIRLINKWSNNVMTRQLMLTVGANRFGAPATLEKGQKAVLEILQEQGIDTEGIVIDNGSGLSRNTRISARQMAQLLEVAYRDAFMPEFMSSLSVPGLDGTLVSRFRKEDMAGRSHLKTGTLNYVTAISGYMLNRHGRRLVIVIQQNGPRASAAVGAKIQDEILRWAFEQ